MNVYLDASVIIAALLSPTGGSAKVIEFGRLGRIHTITSQTVIQEVMEHLGKIGKSGKEVGQFINHNHILVREKVTSEEIFPYQGQVDREDAHLVAGSLSTECVMLVTLDKRHLLKRDIKDRFKSLSIVSPKEILVKLTA